MISSFSRYAILSALADVKVDLHSVFVVVNYLMKYTLLSKSQKS